MANPNYISMKNDQTKGFTLTELMIALLLASILIAVAVPNFRGSIRNNRLTTAANTFVTSLRFARSEAIKRGMIVTLRKTGANWEEGWKMFTDDSTPGVIDDPPDKVLRVGEALPDNFTLHGADASDAVINYISYRPDGRSNTNGNFVSFVICDDSDGNGVPESQTSRMIIVSKTGSVRIAQDSDNNGVPEAPSDGTNIISCQPPFT